VRTKRWKYIRNLHPEFRFASHVTAGYEKPAYWPTWVTKAEKVKAAARKVERYEQRPAEELYDLETDPYEQKNLAADPTQAERLAEMRQDLDAWMQAQGDQQKVY